MDRLIAYGPLISLLASALTILAFVLGGLQAVRRRRQRPLTATLVSAAPDTPKERKRSSLGGVLQFIMVLAVLGGVAVIGYFSHGLSPGLPDSPTVPPKPADVTGHWDGCIQGYLGPNEKISLDISTESDEGALTGMYIEDYSSIALLANEFIQGQWDMYNARIELDKSIMFSANPVATDIGLDALFGGTRTYTFTGTLDDSGTLSGQVTENPGDSLRNWTVSRSGACPY